MFLRKFFFSHPELKQPIIDDKEKLLADLNKETIRKGYILLMGTLSSMIITGASVGIYYLLPTIQDVKNYLEDQKNPNTWEKPCGDIVALLSKEAGAQYNTEECFTSGLEKAFQEIHSNGFWYDFWNTLNYNFPACYKYCMNMPIHGPGNRTFAIVVILLASLVSIPGLCYGLYSLSEIVSMKDLSQDYQRRVKEYLSTHGHEEISADTTVAKLKEILNDLDDDPRHIVLNV